MYRSAWRISHRIASSLFLVSAALVCSPMARAHTPTLQLTTPSVNQCLQVQGSNVIVGNCDTALDPQKWAYDSDKKTLKSLSGQCIDGTEKYSPVSLKSCNGKKEQKWKFEQSKKRFKNEKTKQCLDLFESAANGVVGSWKCHEGDNQQWYAYTAPPPPPTTSPFTVTNGAHGQCLNSSNPPYANVRDCNTDNSQKWHLTDKQQLLADNGKCLEATSSFDLLTQTTCSSSSRQQWSYNETSKTFVNAATNQCLDVWGGELNNEVGVWTCDNSTRQQWERSDITPPPPPPPSADATPIRNLMYGQCVASAGTNIVNTADCVTGDNSQLWEFTTNQELKNNQGLCIDASTPSEVTSLIVCNGSPAQQWQYIESRMNYINLGNHQCLDLWGGIEGNEIAVWECDGSIRQQFEPISSTPPLGNAWQSMGLTFNGRAVAVDSYDDRLFFSLPDGYTGQNDWLVSVNYDPNSPYTLKAQGKVLSNGSTVTLNNVGYGSRINVGRYNGTTLEEEYTLILTNLPIIQLNADLITDEPKREGTFQLSSGHFLQNTDTLKMGIEVRGATSQAFPKKSYSLQLGKDSDWTDELKLALLGMRKDGDWILDAAYRDQTFVRNLVNHNIYREIHPYVYKDDGGQPQGQSSIRGEQVEVILNGRYHGIYILSEKADRKMLGLRKVDVPSDANGNDLWDQVDFSLPKNGSVLYKGDFAEASFLDANNYRVGYEQKYPKASDIVRWEPLDNLADFITNSSDSDFVSGVNQRFDMDSLVDFWALVLAGQAQDNTQKNFFFARNEQGKFAITTWDFDATFGMFWDGSPDSSPTWFFPTGDNRLFQRLMALPATGFNDKLKTRWVQLRGQLFTPDALADRFQQYIDQAELGDARNRNFDRWPSSGGAGAGLTQLGTRGYIHNFLVERLPFVDGQIEALP